MHFNSNNNRGLFVNKMDDRDATFLWENDNAFRSAALPRSWQHWPDLEGLSTATAVVVTYEDIVVHGDILIIVMSSAASGGDDDSGYKEAMVSMIICMIILLIFFIFFCLLPVYRLDAWSDLNNKSQPFPDCLSVGGDTGTWWRMILGGMWTPSSSLPAPPPPSTADRAATDRDMDPLLLPTRKCETF